MNLVGRVVHYIAKDGEGPYAALISEELDVANMEMRLHVFLRSGITTVVARHSEEPRPGHWYRPNLSW